MIYMEQQDGFITVCKKLPKKKSEYENKTEYERTKILPKIEKSFYEYNQGSL